MRKIAREDFGYLSESKSADVLRQFAEKSLSDTFDILMSHRSLGFDVIYGLTKRIEKLGYAVYVDTIVDHDLDPAAVTKETAQRLKIRMEDCRCLFFATSANSKSSVWMPWELGYFDGRKNGKLAILPVSESVELGFKGQEHPRLVCYVDVYGLGTDILWINDSASKFTSFDSWLRGQEPIQR